MNTKPRCIKSKLLTNNALNEKTNSLTFGGPNYRKHYDEDVLDEQQVASSKKQGVELIRQHLEVFLEMHPNAAYFAWTAALHPENAQVTIIDTLFLKPKNTWHQLFQQVKNDGNALQPQLKR